MPFQIIREDITRIRADAIVNTANPKPVFGRGTDHAVYLAAGKEELLKERRKIGEIAPGEAAATKAFGLRAKYIIHTVGPKWQGGEKKERELLASCYRKSLYLSRQLGCKSIAFPLISAGSYGFPKEEALRIALEEIRAFLEEEEMTVTLAVFDRTAFALSETLIGRVNAYIDDNYAEKKREEEYAGWPENRKNGLNTAPRREDALWQDTGVLPDLTDYEPLCGDALPEAEESAWHTGPQPEEPMESESGFPSYSVGSAERPAYPRAKESRPVSYQMAFPTAAAAGKKDRKLKDLMEQTRESFQEMLLRMIDEKGFSDVDVYKRANIDRKLFSKIRSNPAYQPKKRTAIALAMALELNMDETIDLISRAGLALSPASKADLIIGYCIENRIFDLFTVNSLLFDYDQPLLGV